MITSIICKHTHHLFVSPLCNKQSILKRICNIVFHILTLGIPLLLYRVIAFCIDSEQKSVLSKSVLKYGQEAVIFTKKLLLRMPSVKWDFWTAGNETYYNSSPHADVIISLYWEYAFKNFKKALKENQQDTWRNKKVVKAADELLKVSYALFEYAVASLPSLQEKGINCDVIDPTDSIEVFLSESLRARDGYLIRSLCYFWSTYIWIRHGVTWNDKKRRFEFFFEEDVFSEVLAKEYEEHCIPFNIEGAIQNDWKLSYNEYCDRFKSLFMSLDYEDIKRIIPDKDDGSADSRLMLSEVESATSIHFDTMYQDLRV